VTIAEGTPGAASPDRLRDMLRRRHILDVLNPCKTNLSQQPKVQQLLERTVMFAFLYTVPGHHR